MLSDYFDLGPDGTAYSVMAFYIFMRFYLCTFSYSIQGRPESLRERKPVCIHAP